MIYHIYGLYSTEDNIIRYVGQTKSDLKQRKNEHKCDALTRNLKNHKCNWIRSVYKNGFEIGIILIEDTDENHWQEKEIYWISEYSKNDKLVNQLGGGNSGGPGGKMQNFLNYQDAKDFVKNNFTSSSSITSYKKEYEEKKDFCHSYIPKNPQHVYAIRGEWRGWGDYLSTYTVPSIQIHKNFLSFSDACAIVRENNIKNRKEYVSFSREHKNLPQSPDIAYKGEWVDWSFFLTGEKRVKKFSYNEFCDYISKVFMELPGVDNYEKMHTEGKIDTRCPYHPSRVYNKKYSEIRKDIDEIKVWK